ncbi:Crp/Fnr family transcriptional regulator [uncultured Aquimarina sp.]|uniref:Crp/Fnr family transcriptional regulator n=1 Tax=uncultured Aquimarina sp. TaxID=575652 RepID=UPI00260B0B60|nr:Crp/Fnr family transcriptional regulator [uncultured Aquimarina sp.]
MLDSFIKQLNILEDDLKRELRENAEITHHNKGEVIIKNNQYIKVLKIVLKGKVRVYQEYEDREILIYYLTSMETCTLSLSACFADSKSNVSAIAKEDSTILNIPVRFIKDWNFKYKSWNAFTINIFRESYNSLLSSYSNLAFKSLKERLLEFLISVSRNSIINKSHLQIAMELGTTREVISRLLKKMESDGEIQLGQREIKLLL